MRAVNMRHHTSWCNGVRTLLWFKRHWLFHWSGFSYLFLALFHFRLVRRVSPRSSGEVLKMRYCHLCHYLAVRWTTAPTKKEETPLIKVNSTIVKYVRKFSTRGVTTVYTWTDMYGINAIIVTKHLQRFRTKMIIFLFTLETTDFHVRFAAKDSIEMIDWVTTTNPTGRSHQRSLCSVHKCAK